MRWYCTCNRFCPARGSGLAPELLAPGLPAARISLTVTDSKRSRFERMINRSMVHKMDCWQLPPAGFECRRSGSPSLPTEHLCQRMRSFMPYCPQCGQSLPVSQQLCCHCSRLPGRTDDLESTAGSEEE